MARIYGEHTTEAGTKLPLINLKGKPYLQVAHRLVWFREVFPQGSIVTKLLHDDGEKAVFRAEIHVKTDHGPMLVSSGHKAEEKASFSDYREKAETGAVGRALAMAGIGTQFCETDLEENGRLADAPVDLAKKASSVTSSKKPSFLKKTAKKVADTEDDI